MGWSSASSRRREHKPLYIYFFVFYLEYLGSTGNEKLSNLIEYYSCLWSNNGNSSNSSPKHEPNKSGRRIPFHQQVALKGPLLLIDQGTNLFYSVWPYYLCIVLRGIRFSGVCVPLSLTRNPGADFSVSRTSTAGQLLKCGVIVN